MPFNYTQDFRQIQADPRVMQQASRSPFQIAGEAMSKLEDDIDTRLFAKDIQGVSSLEDLMKMTPTTEKSQKLMTQKQNALQALANQKYQQDMLGLTRDKFGFTKEQADIENAYKDAGLSLDMDRLGYTKEQDANTRAFNALESQKERALRRELAQMDALAKIKAARSKAGLKLTPVEKATQEQAGATLALEMLKPEKQIGKEFEEYQEDKNIFWDVGLGKQETEELSNWNKAFLAREDVPNESKVAFSMMTPMQKAKILAAINNQTVEEGGLLDFLAPKWLGGSDYRFKQIKPK